MNFTVVGFLDTFDLAGSLRTRLGLFDAGEPRTLPVRIAKGDGFVATRKAADWAELKVMLSRIRAIGDQNGGIEFGRIFFEMLEPNCCLPWDGADPDGYARAHLSLRTNPGCMMYAGIESAHLAPGFLTIVSRGVWGSAVNLGQYPRIHLVVDFRRRADA